MLDAHFMLRHLRVPRKLLYYLLVIRLTYW